MRKKDTIQVFDLPLPNTEDLERKVLADAICAPELLGDTIPVIHPDFFTTPERRTIWETIVDRYNRGEEVGFTLGEVIGQPFFTEVIPYTSEAGTSETPFRAAMLRNGAAKRRAYMAAAQFLQDAIKPGIDEQEILTSVEAFTRSVEGPAPLQGERPLADVLDEVKKAEIDKTEKAINAGKRTRITTGFQTMDAVLNGGFKGGQLVILAARPSVGKTALMLQMAKAAAKDGNRVQVYSLEMQATELAERILYSTGQVTPYQVNNGLVDRQKYEYAELSLKPLPLYINDFSRSLDEIVSRLTQSVKKGRCQIAFIDYLGLMQDAVKFGANAKLYQVIARITGTMKAVAKRMEIPIVLLCQLNRDAAREDRAPQLFDLRDSGSIEQDADIVLMLESKVITEGKLYVWLRKHRAGKKEVGFVLEPNETYSAFTEGIPVTTDGAALPPPPQPTQADLDLPEDDIDNLPF